MQVSRLSAADRGIGMPPLMQSRMSTSTTRTRGRREIPSKPHKGKTKPAVRVQYGALPYRFTPEAAMEILLVTTRQSRRWIIPKGWPIKGLKPAKSAAREAFEEAGVRGRVAAKSIGLFTYDKLLDETGNPCELRGQSFSAAGEATKRSLARARTARGSVGRPEQSRFHDQGAGAQGLGRGIRQARV